MNNSSQHHGRSASPNNKNYDEERLEWGSVSLSSWPKKYLRLPRLRKTAIYLILIDILITLVVVRCFNPLITLLVRNEELFGARLTLPLDKDPERTEPPADQQLIPRILHQTAATDLIPDQWIHSQKSCKDAYSEFEYKLWTDDSAREFIAAEYPWFVETWDKYPFNIQRADALRYFVLNHFGGLYLDMDTLCNETIPLHQIEADGAQHYAVFKSTTPTGVSNDLMITTARHPLFGEVIQNLELYYHITRPWSGLIPHVAVMMSAGPFFLSMVIKNYLIALPSLPTPAVQVINETELAPYITDLEGCSWHHGDTKTLMYIGDHPWIWFTLGGIGLAIGLHIINYFLMLAFKGMDKSSANDDNLKVAKLT
ncbi:nucleotide-diphospho-sugar transferase [Mariannaea sp. PMI_226]|nr:nucleotide-diphospho-sugar transferase [Mariannaea sp. PMI_226]